jgi:UDPglucose 6-dehydrogenase
MTPSTLLSQTGSALADPLRIAVIGTGYVGLVGAACLAEIGHHVVAVDTDRRRLEALMAGSVPFHEPGLEAMVIACQSAGRLRFVSELESAIEGANLIFIAVGTPAGPDGSTDLDAVTAAAARIGTTLRRPATIVIKSTVPVGTTDRLAALIDAGVRARGIGWHVSVVGNPEFLREGSAIHDFMRPDRIVVGARRAEDAALLMRAYAPLTERGAAVLTMSPRSAELTKYASNAMLAARISFINEIAAIAEASGADIEEVRVGIGSDARIGATFLRPGIGYGGSCFPKDVASLAHSATEHAVQPRMLRAIEQVNARQKRWAFDRLQAFYSERGGLQRRRIALWGLAFKPGTDDMREAPSLTLIELLLAAGALVSAYDPIALETARGAVVDSAGIRWCSTAAEALAEADALVLATEWDEFRIFPPGVVASMVLDRFVVDGRNALDAPAWAAAGLQLIQVGRPPLPSATPRAATANGEAARARAGAGAPR